jgi:uncharacterized protein (TIGR03086 family)
MTEISDRYQRLSTEFAETIAAVPADRWADPSPCEGWSARDVVRHVIDTHNMFEGFVGRKLAAGPSVDDDPGAAWDAARSQVLAELTDPEKAGEGFEGFFGPQTFERAVDQFLSGDLVVHRWDLAKATGGDLTIPADEMERGWAQFREFGPALRSPNVFGPEVEVSAEADEQTRFLAFTGRRA